MIKGKNCMHVDISKANNLQQNRNKYTAEKNCYLFEYTVCIQVYVLVEIYYPRESSASNSFLNLQCSTRLFLNSVFPSLI